MKTTSEKSKKELIKEINNLKKTINELKKEINKDIISSSKDLTIHDLELISEQETDAIFKGDENGNFIFVNEYASKITGYSQEELLKMNMKDLFSSETLKNRPLRFDLVNLGKTVKTHRKITKKNKETLLVEMVSGKLPNKDLITILHDVSLENKLFSDLKKSEQKYKLLFEMLPYGGEVLNTEGKIIDVSSGTIKMLGYKKTEILGKHISEFIDKKDIKIFKEKFKKMLKGNTMSGEISLLKKNGSIVNVYRAGQPILNSSGKVESILTLSLDITKRKEVEKKLIEKNKIFENQNQQYIYLNNELQIAKEKAEESNRLKSAFLANMSHEIRTPMNGILGFSQLLNMPGISEEKITEYTSIILQSGNHLLNIINDIIDISKIDAGQFNLIKTTFNINTTLRELFLFFKSFQKIKDGIELGLKIPLKDENANIVTDKTRFIQIFTNLINNAIKFTDKGFVEFGYKIKNNTFIFFVKDTGIGIKKEMQNVIFDRFMQAAVNTEKLYGGTGLGLAISKACAELLGGDIWMKSKLGEGSLFEFTIDTTVSLKTHKKIKKDVDSIKIKKTKDNFNGKVLIVEDDEDSFSYLKAILNESKIDFIRVETAKKAIETVKISNVNLVLMDIQLPGKDGNYAIREIKKINSKLPVIVQSAYAFENEKKESFDAGCDDYLVKPIRKHDLLDKLKQYLN